MPPGSAADCVTCCSSCSAQSLLGVARRDHGAPSPAASPRLTTHAQDGGPLLGRHLELHVSSIPPGRVARTIRARVPILPARRQLVTEIRYPTISFLLGGHVETPPALPPPTGTGRSR